jgi:hypothetical protein
MAEYSWYNPFTWDMQNNPAYRAGESYYDLTQGENAPPVNEDTWQLATEIVPLYNKFINDKLKGFNYPTPDLTMPNNLLNNFESISPNTGGSNYNINLQPSYGFGTAIPGGLNAVHRAYNAIPGYTVDDLRGVQFEDTAPIADITTTNVEEDLKRRGIHSDFPIDYPTFQEDYTVRGKKINEMPQQKKGWNINWPDFLPTPVGIMQAIGNKFKRSPQKQAEFEAYEASKNEGGWGDFGDYKGNIYRDPGTNLNRINIVDPTTGVTLLRNKNFDSMFGSDSVEEMIAKKDAWIQDRILNQKPLSKALEIYAKSKGFYGPSKYVTRKDKVQDAPKFKPTFDPTPDYRGPHGDSGPSWHGATAARQKAGKKVAGPGFGKGAYWSEGGRVGYKTGGRVGILSVF